MEFMVYDKRTRKPIVEELFLLSENGMLFRWNIGKGGKYEIEPIEERGAYLIRFRNGEEWVY